MKKFKKTFYYFFIFYETNMLEIVFFYLLLTCLRTFQADARFYNKSIKNLLFCLTIHGRVINFTFSKNFIKNRKLFVAPGFLALFRTFFLRYD